MSANTTKYIMPPGIDEIPPNAGVPTSSTEQVGGKKSKKNTKTTKTTKKSHKGGDLMSDLKNLAVPFAILLAKQSVEKMSSDKKTKTSKSPEMSRRKSIAGGSSQIISNSQQVKKNFSKLAEDINQFFKKY